MLPDEHGELQQVQGFPSIDPDMDARTLAAAKWAYDKKRARRPEYLVGVAAPFTAERRAQAPLDSV